MRPFAPPLALLFLLAGCSSSSKKGAPDAATVPAGCTGPAALATCIVPTMTREYYADQSNKYFDTLDARADQTVVPNYSKLVARWEWPPWLKLTGYGKDMMIELDRLLVERDPSTVPLRDCRGFATQPFGRCHISFDYGGKRCPIYEEFAFNAEGEITFIEAWSDLPGLRPMSDPNDTWAEGPGVRRLATKIPGLGGEHGLIDLDSEGMKKAAAQDPEVADFVARAKAFWATWSAEYQDAGASLFARGCGW